MQPIRGRRINDSKHCTLKKVVTIKYSRRGKAGAAATIPAERRTERSFGSTGTGRAKLERLGVKLQHSRQELRPRDDCVLLALTRIIEERGHNERNLLKRPERFSG